MYLLQWTEQLVGEQVIGIGHHHDELEAFSLLPCVEADLQPHLHCSDLALTQYLHFPHGKGHLGAG